MNALDTLRGSAQDLPLFIRLPFVTEAGEQPGFCYWSVNSTGNYQHDFILGEAMAQYALLYLREDGDPSGRLLSDIVLDMMDAGKDSVGKGVAVGFFGAIEQAIPRLPCRALPAPTAP